MDLRFILNKEIRTSTAKHLLYKKKEKKKKSQKNWKFDKNY